MSGYKKVGEKLLHAIVPLYHEGLNPKVIAGRVGCAHATVYAALHQAGVELQRRNYKRMKIKPVSYTGIDPIWAAEFRGFFYGDGSVMLNEQRVKEHNVVLYRPRLMITLRVDSLPLLEDIQARLRGSVDQHRGIINSWGYQCNPTARWYTCDYANILAIIRDVLLPGALLPAPKRAQIEVLYEAILARLDLPYNLGPEGREALRSYYIRLKELKRY